MGGKLCRGGDLPEAFLRWGKGRIFLGGGDFWPGDTENIFFGAENEFWVGIEKIFLGGFNNFFGGEFAGVDPPKKKIFKAEHLPVFGGGGSKKFFWGGIFGRGAEIFFLLGSRANLKRVKKKACTRKKLGSAA